MLLLASTTAHSQRRPYDDRLLPENKNLTYFHERAAAALLPPEGYRLASELSGKEACSTSHHQRTSRRLIERPCEHVAVAVKGVLYETLLHNGRKDRPHLGGADAWVYWLAAVAASVPADCQNFTLCWQQGDGATSLYSSSGHDDAIAPPSSYSSSSSSSSSNSSHPPTPPPPLFGCYSSSVQPRSGHFPWYNRIDARHLVSFGLRQRLAHTVSRSPFRVYGDAHFVAFANRSHVPVWRGSSRSRPSREALVAFSRRRPDLLDAAFSTGKDASPAMIPEWDYFSAHQVVVVTSGVGAAFRTARHMSNGQVVVLLQGGDEYSEWFYPLLTPFVDFVPVDSFNTHTKFGAAELEATLTRLVESPELRQTISRGARRFFERHFLGFWDIGRRFACRLAEAQRRRGVDVEAVRRANGATALQARGAYDPTARLFFKDLLSSHSAEADAAAAAKNGMRASPSSLPSSYQETNEEKAEKRDHRSEWHHRWHHARTYRLKHHPHYHPNNRSPKSSPGVGTGALLAGSREITSSSRDREVVAETDIEPGV
jgi:hypothetical protein